MSSFALGKLREVVKSNAGLLLVVASEAFYASMDVSVQLLTTTGGPNITVLEILFLRMIVTYVFSVSYMYYAKIDHPILGPPEVRHILLCRGFSGFFGVWGLYYSLQYLSLSDATVLTFISPLCTAIAGSFLLKERFTKREALGGIVSLLGVVLIARPPFIFGTAVDHGEEELRVIVENGAAATSQRMVAVGVSLIGVLGATGAYISIRAAGKRAHPLHNMTYFSAHCVIVSTVGMIVTHSPVVIPSEWPFLGMLLLISIFGFLAQTLMTMGLQIQAAGRASMGAYTQVIFALILERVVFGTVPVLLSVLGTALILGSALYVVMKKEDGGRITLAEANGEEGLV